MMSNPFKSPSAPGTSSFSAIVVAPEVRRLMRASFVNTPPPGIATKGGFFAVLEA